MKKTYKKAILVELLSELRAVYEQAKLKSQQYEVWTIPTRSEDLREALSAVPLQVGRGAWRGVLFEEEIHCDFGGPGVPSMAAVLCVRVPEIVHDGRVTLVGPDLPELPRGTHELGILVFVGGRAISDRMLNRIRRVLFLSDEIEGFAQRSLSRKQWFRVSRDLVSRGVSFRDIAAALALLFREAFPELVETVEVYVITTLPAFVGKLVELGVRVKETYTRAFQERVYEYAQRQQALLEQDDKLRADCDFDWECNVCEFQTICDELRQIVEMRKQQEEAPAK